MDNQFMVTKQACLEWMTKSQIQYILHEHEPAPTMAHMLKVPVNPETVFIKTLFYVDKKNNYYFVLAKNETQVGKQFWKSIGLSSGNMRLAKQEQIQEAIQSQIGHVNPFSLMNDHTDAVKKVIVDQALKDSKTVALVPIENNATVEISLSDMLERVIKAAKKEFQFVSLSDAAIEAELAAENQQKLVQVDHQQTLAITVKKSENFSKWYSQVITKSEMIEYYDVSGCYILRPWAYCIWEHIQRFFDDLIRTEEVDNTYFPMFISQKQLTKEKDHVEGFKAEVAWVTKYGESDLNEPIAIRPTSETIMYPAFAKWVKSHRDLPVKVNQWTNIVRWEFKFPTPFIRTREFLWQEGHTAHSNAKESVEQVYKILDFYEMVYKELAVPVIKGIKTESEKFAGGDFTTTVETIIPQNGRGLQAATSHHLGQNFSKMFEIEFEDDKKQKQFAWQTSWGLTTRSIGAMIMFHGDDKGLVIPPRVVKYQVVLIPILSKEVNEEQLYAKCVEIKKQLLGLKIRTHYDNRENHSPGWKYNHWEQKGVTLRLEVGPGELKNEEVRVVQRIDNKKYQLKWAEFTKIPEILEQIQEQMYLKAEQQMQQRIKQANNWQEFMHELNKQNTLITRWCGNEECEKDVKTKSGKESKEQDSMIDGQIQLTGAAKTLCVPLKQDKINEGEVCFNCGKEAKKYVLWGRSY